jgi:uncharacterized RDD family membrane protein YckC
LKVVKTDGSELTFFDLAKRHLLDMIEIMFVSPIGVTVSICNRKGQRLGDLLGNTQVLHV